MKDYKINYIPAFNNYNPQDAYNIVTKTQSQYAQNISAPLTVRGVLDSYNWVKIFDKRQKVFKSQ
jgi:hypothetical protein